MMTVDNAISEAIFRHVNNGDLLSCNRMDEAARIYLNLRSQFLTKRQSAPLTGFNLHLLPSRATILFERYMSEGHVRGSLCNCSSAQIGAVFKEIMDLLARFPALHKTGNDGHCEFVKKYWHIDDVEGVLRLCSHE